MRIKHLAIALVWLASTLSAAAQQVLYVDNQGSGGYEYSTLQAAVDAALDGATIVIRPGNYPAASIAGKRLDLVGLAGDAGERVQLAGLTISGLGSWDMGVRDVDIAGFSSMLQLQQCAARLLIERSALTRVQVSDCPAVVLATCTISQGLSASGANLTLYDTTIDGGYPAQTGIQLTGSELFAHGCTIRGGWGIIGQSGSAFLPLCSNGGPGGTGIVLSDSTALAIDTSVLGDPGGPAGIALGIPMTCFPGPTGPVSSGAGLTIINPPGNLHRLESSAVAKAGQPFTLQLFGNAGEHSFLFVSTALLPLFLPTWNGVLLPNIATGILLPTGSLPPSGNLPLTYALNVPPPLQSVSLAVQGLFVHPGGLGPNYMSGPTFVRLFAGGILLADCNGNVVPDEQELSAASDCDADGKLDVCAIAQGLAPDCNGNGRPDACDLAQGISLDLDLNGIPDECATVLRVPSQYATLQQAISAAPSGALILLKDGTYAGDGFRNLQLEKPLTIASENGPSACHIELTGANDFFVSTGHAVALRGIHLFDLSTGTVSASDWPALLIGNVGLYLRDCHFEGLSGGSSSVVDCSQSGAAPGTLVRIEGCRFEGNRSARMAGAVSIFQILSTNRVEILRCYFDGNEAGISGVSPQVADGGAVRLSGGAGSGMPPHLISDCLFTGNRSTSTGGALYSGSQLEIRNGTFVNNASVGGARASLGGAIRSFGPLRVRSSIFWDKTALGAGDSISMSNSPSGIGGQPILAYCLFPAGPDQMSPGTLLTQSGPGLLNLSPGFVSASDWHLSPGSPAIDAGDPAYLPGPSAIDLDGNPRLQGPAVDLGCYESSPAGP